MNEQRYDPQTWRSGEQISTYISVNSPYRVVASRTSDGQSQAVLVDDVKKTVHTLDVPGQPFTKRWYLSVLKQLDDGTVPAQTRESLYGGLDAYRPWSR